MKSAQQMVVTANDLHDAGVDVPLLVGGAALSEKYTTGKIGPSYYGADFLREGRDDRTAHYERDHGSGDAGRRLGQLRLPRRLRIPERFREKVDAGTITQREGADGYSDSLLFPIWIATSAQCRSLRRSGAISTRSCSMGGIWATRATSRSTCCTRREGPRSVQPHGRGEGRRFAGS